MWGFGLALITAVIGGLGYYDVDFTIESTPFRGKLACEAIFNSLSSKGQDPHILIFAPESIIVNLHESSSYVARLLRQPEEVKQQIHQKLVELIPSVSPNKLTTALTQSQGEYKSKGRSVTLVFENTVENVVSHIFSQLLLYLNKTREKSLIVDISTGQNLYVTSLLEAVRGVLVYNKLNHLLQGDERIGVEIAYVPPIYATNQNVRVEFHPYDVKAFFELPIRGKDINLNRVIRVSQANQQTYYEEAKRIIYLKTKELKTHLITGRLTYNAIKYNTPLVLFHDQITGRLRQFEEITDFPERLYGLISTLEQGQKEITESNGRIKVSRYYSIDKDLFINLHFHLALLNSIYRFWKQQIEGREPELEYIRQIFSEVYRRLGLGLNSKFLERDCNEISTAVNNYEGDLTHAKLLEDIIKSEPKDQIAKPPSVKPSDPKRNFFAHSGLSYNITKVTKRNGHILLSYENEAFEKEVMSWIEDPEG
jgi:CRISPR-associated protein Csx1